MLRLTFWHEPEGFHFFVRDPTVRIRTDRARSDERLSRGFAVQDSEISIRTLSEFSELPITVEYSHDGCEAADFDRWDHVVECSLESKSGKFVLEGTTAPQPFGELEVPSGRYRVRIHFGGQLTGKQDGSTEDFYLLQIWPSEDTSVKVLKGELLWPRPKQPWERR